MKHNWEYKQWNEVLKIFNGKNQKAVENPNGPYPIYGSGGIMSYADNYICPENCTIIGRKGNINNPIFVPTKFWNVDTAFGLCPNDFLQPRYLYYFCQIYDFEKHNKATTIPSLVKNDLLKISMPVPPMETQEQIVAELDQINDLIAKNRKLLSQLNALAQSLFYDTFGDPIYNPKGWESNKLGSLLIIERGGSPRPIKDYITQDEDGINWIKIGDADSSMYISSTKEKIKPSGKSKSRFVKPGDFILSNSMSFGRPYIMNTYGCIHDGWLLLRDENNVFNKVFLYYCLNSKSLYSEFERLVRTGTVSNLNSDIVRGVRVPVPPLALQEDFAAKVEAIEAQKAKVEAEIAELQTLLDARMDYWFN